MKISESTLRKIVREEIESINEMDPSAAAAVSAGVSGALGLSPAAQQVLVAAIAGAGGFAAAYKMHPGLEGIVSKIPGLLEKIKKVMGVSSKNESVGKKTKLIKESAMSPETIDMLLQAVAALSTAGVGANVLNSYLEDVARKFSIKPDSEEKFFGEKL
jgi:hypothetical protein